MPDETVCPGCGLRSTVSDECQRLCHELAFYTLSQGDTFFIHQVAVDAYAAQHAGPSSKPIGVAFALIGLYLLHERNYSGKDVQNAHMRLARLSKEWPSFRLPSHRGNLTVADVVATEPGTARDTMVMKWAASVWAAWHAERAAVAALLKRMSGTIDHRTSRS
jgi:hypothetical protein